MHKDVNNQTAVIVESFAYVANQLAKKLDSQSQSEGLVTNLTLESEKYKAALRLIKRDVFEASDKSLRSGLISKTGFDSVRHEVTFAVEESLKGLDEVVKSFQVQKLAA